MFINISRDLLGINPWDGVAGQESSFGKRGEVAAGTMGKFQEKCVDLKPGEKMNMAELEGPGVITRIWMALPYWINPGATRNLVLTAFFDGEEKPSVQTPVGDFFGATFGRPKQYASAYTGITSGAYISFFPMPFKEKAILAIENQGRSTARLLFYQVSYLRLTKDLPRHIPHFHCQWHRERCEPGSPPYTILSARGRGFYMGCHLNMQGRGSPWHLNPIRVQLPEGFGMGMLEGWETIWIDNAEQPNIHGTGGEDYFNGAWYFTRTPSTWPTHGVTQRRYDLRRVSCYRFHAEMPIYFQKKLEVRLDHGLDNMLPVDIDGTSYWYQVEPHAPFDPLPTPGERQPVSAAGNRLVMLAPGASLMGGYGLYRTLRKRNKNPRAVRS